MALFKWLIIIKFSNVIYIQQAHIYLKVNLILLFYSDETTGGWSNEGIIQDSDPRSPIMCSSTHLTSFAVLVSAEGGHDLSVSTHL